MCILPTIQEVSKEEEEEGEDETLGFVLSPLEDDISSHLRAISLPSNGDVGFKEVHLLIDAAKQRATQGNEEKAIEIYKDGVNILEQEVKRILKQMEESVTSKPKFEKTALYIVLHEEWAEAAGLMADIRTMMSTLYERQEEYDKAICCCEEAKSIYERQAIFDERHHKKGSTARDKEASMENMMEAIDEARETQGIRQSMHETVERIQTKLEATKDETSRGFLYEDIFDKLSTVLSLELMYLGEMHPQIANTKVLLSMYYIEIGQNDKALRTMNDAILICEIGLGDSHPKTGTKYHEAAKLYERIGGEENVLKSIDLYEKAIATLEKAEGDHSETLASILNSVGALYIKQTKYDVAVERLKDAILVIAKDNGDKSDDFSTEHVQLWLNLAECHSLRKEASLSINALRNAARVQRDKRKKYDALEKDVGNLPDLLTNTGISLTLRRLGTSLAAELKFDDATDCFLEALSLVKADLDTVKELAKFDPNIDLPLHQDEVASVLYDLAKVKQEDDKYDEALKLYRESLHLRKESDSDKAVDKRSNRVACAMCLAGMGSINLLQNKPDEAFKRFNQAIYYIKQEGIPDSHSIARMLWQKSHIAASDMKRVKIQSEKSTSNEIKLTTITQLEEQAEAFRKGRDYVKCMKTLDTVIGMKRDCLKRAEEEKKRVENARCQLAVSLIAMGDTMLITNAKKKSADCLTEAYGLLKSSGVPANNKHFRRIEKIRRSIRKMKERSETMAEF
ncbi:unnamed protein product [Pseudo-nitzschia multistriata]|uniref:MalT-like TPR region domain-containing protein n=1 Tax=Pseudo-nitzschia multistriata TaxID=183589 RepID=A0A448ZSZ5_9STRA|nr:unnamed protein product [Pseudo-nitzschia multistriata]